MSNAINMQDIHEAIMSKKARMFSVDVRKPAMLEPHTIIPWQKETQVRFGVTKNGKQRKFHYTYLRHTMIVYKHEDGTFSCGVAKQNKLDTGNYQIAKAAPRAMGRAMFESAKFATPLEAIINEVSSWNSCGQYSTRLRPFFVATEDPVYNKRCLIEILQERFKRNTLFKEG